MLRIDLLFFLLIVSGLFFVGVFIGAFFRDRKALLTESALRDMVRLYRLRSENAERLMKQQVVVALSDVSDLCRAADRIYNVTKELSDRQYYRGFERGLHKAFAIIVDKVKPYESC